jgi:hypothetical protein
MTVNIKHDFLRKKLPVNKILIISLAYETWFPSLTGLEIYS